MGGRSLLYKESERPEDRKSGSNLHVVIHGKIIVDGNDLTSLTESSMMVGCQ